MRCEASFLCSHLLVFIQLDQSIPHHLHTVASADSTDQYLKDCIE